MIGGVAERVSSPVLVGRDAEAAQLGAALERAAAGEPAIVVVVVGESRLEAELLRHAGEFGAVALTGGCLNVGEGVLAYAPMVEALRPLARIMDPEELDRVLGGARAELARLVPEFGPQPEGSRRPRWNRRGSTSPAETGLAYPVARSIAWTRTGAQVPYRASAPSPTVREPCPPGRVTRMRDPETVRSHTLGSP